MAAAELPEMMGDGVTAEAWAGSGDEDEIGGATGATAEMLVSGGGGGGGAGELRPENSNK